MAVVNPYIFQIVGFQNSGKTTFMNHLLNGINTEDIRIGTIKHHGHGGKPDILENKDSSSYIRSGARVSLVEGAGRVILQAEKEVWSLEEQIDMLKFLEMDLILLEGYKYKDYPKAVIINKEDELQLLNDLTNIKIVLFRQKTVSEKWQNTLKVPTYLIADNECIKWLVNHFAEYLSKIVDKS
jgi:molybdopterin-guanine dinucleotide biosynthesis adapter protein